MVAHHEPSLSFLRAQSCRGPPHYGVSVIVIQPDVRNCCPLYSLGILSFGCCAVFCARRLGTPFGVCCGKRIIYTAHAKKTAVCRSKYYSCNAPYRGNKPSRLVPRQPSLVLPSFTACRPHGRQRKHPCRSETGVLETSDDYDSGTASFRFGSRKLLLRFPKTAISAELIFLVCAFVCPPGACGTGVVGRPSDPCSYGVGVLENAPLYQHPSARAKSDKSSCARCIACRRLFLF